MTVHHHRACQCPQCTNTDVARLAADPSAVVIKATGTVVVEFEVSTIFTDSIPKTAA